MLLIESEYKGEGRFGSSINDGTFEIDIRKTKFRHYSIEKQYTADKTFTHCNLSLF